MKAILTKLFQKKLTSEEQIKADFLSKTNLFKDLKEKELLLLSEKMYERNYKQNEIVFFRNDAAQALFLVKTGIVFLNLDIE